MKIHLLLDQAAVFFIDCLLDLKCPTFEYVSSLNTIHYNNQLLNLTASRSGIIAHAQDLAKQIFFTSPLSSQASRSFNTFRR